MTIEANLVDRSPWVLFQVMYGGRVIDDFDRRVVKTYMNEYMGDFLFDTFQPFHFYQDDSVDYRIFEVATRDEFVGEFGKRNPQLRSSQSITHPVCSLHRNAPADQHTGSVWSALERRDWLLHDCGSRDVDLPD